MNEIVQKSVGLLNFKLEGISMEETEKYREIISILFEARAFNVKNGSVTLHYDSEGNLMEVETNVKRWKRQKVHNPLVAGMKKSGTINPLSQTHTMSGAEMPR